MSVFCFKGVLRARLHGGVSCGKWLSGEGLASPTGPVAGGHFRRRLRPSVCSGSLGAPLMWVAWEPAFRWHCGVKPGVSGPVLPICRSSRGGWLGARSRVCISSPPGPPWNVCLDSYGVKTLSSYRVRVWPATGIAALSRQTRRED